MGSYNSAAITTAGQSLIARAIAGNLPCTLTSAKTTDYVVPGSTSLASLTSLPDIKQSEAITSARVVSNTQVSASVRFNNTDITLNYMINTIGVYAKVQGDSAETLLAVITAIDPDVMPSYSAASPVAYVYDITLSISNASSVNIVVAPTGSPNYSEFNAVKDEVVAARVGSDDVQYGTLEERLDTEFTDLKSDINDVSKYNYRDAISFLKKKTKIDASGITYTYDANANTFTVSGTKSGTTFCWFYPNDSMPLGVKAGETYYYKYSASNVYFEIWVNGGTRILSTIQSGFVVIPSNATTVALRLATWNADNINETINVPKLINVKAYNEPFIHLNPEMFWSNNSTNAIIEALALGDVMLSEGTYECSLPITLPMGRTLKGSGQNTVLKYIGTEKNFITCSNGNETICDMTINGGLTSKPSTYNVDYADIRRGIVISNDTFGNLPTRIENVSVIGFTKDGILIDGKGYVALCSIVANNIVGKFCGSALTFTEKGEYGVVTNSVFTDNYFGCVFSGGNNKLSNCGLDRNSYGLFANKVVNNTHTDVIGCSFNHNSIYGAMANEITSPLTFTACQLFGSGQWDLATYRVACLSLANCMFGSGKILINKGSDGGLTMFNGCVFEAAPTINKVNDPILVMNSCYQSNGTAITA